MALDTFFDQFKNAQHVVPVEQPNVLLIKWARTGIGFGELALTVGPTGALTIDAETMDAAFVKEVLGALIDEAYAQGRVY